MTKRAKLRRMVMATVLLAACDKAPLQENVYTGPMLGGGMDASRPMLDATVTPTIDASVEGDATVTPMEDPLADTITRECGPRPSAMAPFSNRAWLASVAQCAQRAYCEINVHERDLLERTRALASSPTDQARADAQRAWRDTNASVQRAELFRFGPAAPSMEPGGRNLRAQIYTFPAIDRCLVDEQLVNQAYAQPTFASSSEIGRGLAALESLLFFEGVTNGCSPISNINRNGSWSALASMPEELAKRRRDYAARAAMEVAGAAQALVDAWDPSKGNFTRTWSEPAAGQAIPSEQVAINALGYALFYVDRELKDTKLGLLVPGLTAECPEGCPERAEAPLARVSTDNVVQNLAGFRALFEGCGDNNTGLGVDDALRALGPAGESLASRMLAALTNAERVARTLSPPLESAAVQDPAKVEALYRAIKGITDLLKTEMVTLLDIELPMAAEGDND
jgi:uncharacterized protein